MTKHSGNILIKSIPLLLVIFIDGAGLGLVFPILNAIIIDTHASILPIATTAATRNFLYGFITSVFMFCWFFGAAIISDLSDIIGRKRALFICLLGSFLGYLLSGIAIFFHSISLLILGRVIAGFTAGSQPVAQASIVDICPHDKKATYLGYTLLAVSLGFIVGPIFGGVLSDKNLVSWFDFTVPMYFAAMLSFINIFLLLFLYKETFTITQRIHVKVTEAVRLFISAFKNKEVCTLSFLFLIFVLGWANFYTYISLFSLARYHFTTLQTTLLMGIMGVGFAFGMGYLAKIFDRYNHLRGIVLTLIVSAICTAVIYFTQQPLFLWIFIVPAAAFASVAYVLILTMFSNQVDETRQGWVMGVTGAIMAFAFGATNLLAGVFTDISATLPILLAAIIMAISSILFQRHKNTLNKN